jgi:hypothetical protein
MTAPSVALSFSPTSPKTGEPFVITATVTGDSTAAGIKIRRGTCIRLSGPSVRVEEFYFPSGTGAGSAPKFAGVAKPSTADYVANAGESATSVMKFDARVTDNATGTLAVAAEIVYTLDSDESYVRVSSGSTNVTIAAAS